MFPIDLFFNPFEAKVDLKSLEFVNDLGCKKWMYFDSFKLAFVIELFETLCAKSEPDQRKNALSIKRKIFIQLINAWWLWFVVSIEFLAFFGVFN